MVGFGVDRILGVLVEGSGFRAFGVAGCDWLGGFP